MKLRVRHNSIRLRVGQSEVQDLLEGRSCHESVHFPGSGDAVRASLHGMNILIEVPAGVMAAWCGTQQFGISAQIVSPGQEPLSVLIEKDFRCLDPLVEEDPADTSENPLQHHPCDA